MIKRRLILACLALASSAHGQTTQTAGAAAPLPAFVTPAGVLKTRIGATVARPPAKPGTSVDLFAFIGEAGAMLNATASGAKAGYGVTVYTPEGAEMLTETGIGSAKLTAALPKDAVYILAVTRQNSAEPYKLTLAAEAPDIFQWRLRSSVGYDRKEGNLDTYSQTCWVKPGETMRIFYSNGRFQTITVDRGGTGHLERTDDAGNPVVVRFTSSFADGAITRVYSNGAKVTSAVDAAPPVNGPYREYLCR